MGMASTDQLWTMLSVTINGLLVFIVPELVRNALSLILLRNRQCRDRTYAYPHHPRCFPVLAN